VHAADESGRRRVRPGEAVRSPEPIERRKGVPAFIITRIQTGDYDRWRPLFDADHPRAREQAEAQRVFRSVDDPNHVFVFLQFATVDDANEARRRVVESGVLERFEDVHGPNVLEEVPA
jgi:hypothetical protein